MRRSAALLLLLTTIGCARTPAPPASTSSEPMNTTTMNAEQPRVIFPDGTPITVEIASDDPTREQGLMFRDQLAPNHGMIFVFPANGVYAFWMKNTLIPLDMIWIDVNQKVVDAQYDIPPCKADPCPSYPPKGPALYVLEVAGGLARQHRVKAGDQLRFEHLESVVAR